jgi:hypothetical protein
MLEERKKLEGMNIKSNGQDIPAFKDTMSEIHRGSRLEFFRRNLDRFIS